MKCSNGPNGFWELSWMVIFATVICSEVAKTPTTATHWRQFGRNHTEQLCVNCLPVFKIYICRWCRWVYLNQHFLKWCTSAESFCRSPWSRTYLRFSPHKCGFDICFIPADSANVVQPQSYGLRTGRQKLGIWVFPSVASIFVFKSLFMEGNCDRIHAFSSLNVSQTQIQYTDVYTYMYIIPLSVFGESWVHFKSCTTSDFNVQPVACHCARATVTLLPGLRCLRLILFCLSHCSMQIPWAWKQPWLLTLKERSFFSCFLLIASLLALAWRGRQSGRPTTTVRMPTVATSDAWEDIEIDTDTQLCQTQLSLWGYDTNYHTLYEEEMNQMSQAPGREQAGVLQVRYGLMTSWWTVSFVRFLPSYNELAVTSVYWALWPKEWRALLRIDCLLGHCLNAKWSLIINSSVLEFTRNLLRFAQAHLSLKLLRLKKWFDLARSRVVSVPLDLSMFENDIDLIHIIKYIMVEWSSR